MFSMSNMRSFDCCFCTALLRPIDREKNSGEMRRGMKGRDEDGEIKRRGEEKKGEVNRGRECRSW